MFNDPIDSINELRAASAVRRFHTTRMIRTQTVGEHTFGVMLLLRVVFPEAPPHLFTAVMFHDVAEIHTGDVPGPAKRMFPVLAEALHEVEKDLPAWHEPAALGTPEKSLLSWCDEMECAQWCIEDAAMGNVYALTIVADILHRWNPSNFTGPLTLAARFPATSEIWQAARNDYATLSRRFATLGI